MNHADVIIERASSVSTFTGSGVSLAGAAVSNEVVTYGGLVVAVIALGINWYYKHKTYLQDKKVAEATLKELTGSESE